MTMQTSITGEQLRALWQQHFNDTQTPASAEHATAATTVAATATSRLTRAVALARQAADELAAAMNQSELADVSYEVLADAERELRIAESRSEAGRMVLLTAINRNGLWALEGGRSFANWLARHDRIGGAAAKRETHLADTMDTSLPNTTAEALTGDLAMGQVKIIATAANTDERRTSLAEPITGNAHTDTVAWYPNNPTGEHFLMACAHKFNLNGLRLLCKRFAQVTDPEADERGYRGALEREYVELAPTTGGYHLQGFLTEEHGLALQTTLNTIMGAPSEGETRTTSQRRAAALADLTRYVLDNGLIGTGTSIRPHLTVHINWTQFTELAKKVWGLGNDTHLLTSSEGGQSPGAPPEVWNLLSLNETPPILEGGTGPIPETVLHRLACDSEITRIIYGPDSQILNVGRTHRTFRAGLRRAIIARDQHCTYPDCNLPPSMCEVHHAVTHWADGGNTRTANGALLCWHHHTTVDTQNITMTWGPRPDTPTGHGWNFTDLNGHPIR